MELSVEIHPPSRIQIGYDRNPDEVNLQRSMMAGNFGNWETVRKMSMNVYVGFETNKQSN